MITHGKLIKAAKQWLQLKCSVVATELATSVSETPDAIGWSNGGLVCIVVECKISRSDFLADKKKSHVLSKSSVGDYRYYLTPKDLITKNETPDGCGLVYYDNNYKNISKCMVQVRAPVRDEFKNGTTVRTEKIMLVSIARRALLALDAVKPLSLGNHELDGKRWEEMP